MISRGVFEFKTKPSDFGRIGGEIRLMAEQGRTHLLPLDTKETMVATNAGYSQELYDISCKVFGPIGGNIWQKDYEIKRPIIAKDLTATFLMDMYEKCVSYGVSISDYTAVKWWQAGDSCRSRPEPSEYARYARDIMLSSERQDTLAWTFLIANEKRSVKLYVRTAFLENCNIGRTLLHYLYMLENARKEKEKQKRQL